MNSADIETQENHFVNYEDGLIDTDTGELINLDANDRPVKNGREPSWFKGIKKGFRELSKMDMSAGEMQILLGIMGRLKYGNRIIINQTEWAAEIKCSRESVSRSLAKLEERNIISKLARNPRSAEFRLNPSYCWCGLERGFK